MMTRRQLTRPKHRVLAAIRKAKRYRGEESRCLQFSRWSYFHHETEDALHGLVRLGLVEWFGDNEQPLRYRIPKRSQIRRATV